MCNAQSQGQRHSATPVPYLMSFRRAPLWLLAVLSTRLHYNLISSRHPYQFAISPTQCNMSCIPV